MSSLDPGNPMSRRALLLALPGAALAPRVVALAAQAQTGPPIRVQRLLGFGLRVSDVSRSVEFYQGLFGMPVQARAGKGVSLRVGAGPQFISVRPLEPGEAPA